MARISNHYGKKWIRGDNSIKYKGKDFMLPPLGSIKKVKSY